MKLVYKVYNFIKLSLMNETGQVNHIQQMKSVQKQIITGLELLNNLNSKYKMKTQKGFINTFLHVMDRMSNDLIDAQEHYKNIDKQIAADKKCVTLAKELNFFKTQCLQLKKQLQQVKFQLTKERNKNFILSKQSQNLNKALTKKVKQIEKYKTLSLSKQKNEKNKIAFNQMNQTWKSINLDEPMSRTERIQRQKLIRLKKTDNGILFPQKLQTSQENSYTNRLRFRNIEERISQQYRPLTKSFNRDLFTRQQSNRSSNKQARFNKSNIQEINN